MSAQPRISVAAYRRGPGRPRERSVHVEILRWLRANVSALVIHPRNDVADKRGAIGGSRDKALGVEGGASDLIGVVEAGPLAGHFFAVEVKRPGVVPSEIKDSQLRFGRMVEERGGLFLLATSVDEVAAWARSAGIVRPTGWRAPWAAERGLFDL